MHYLLALPGLVPAAPFRDQMLDHLSISELNFILGRGAIKRTSLNFEEWLGKLFSFKQEKHLPLAPLTYQHDGGTAKDEYVLRADPVHLQINRDSLSLVGNDVLPLTAEESASLTSALNKHFAELNITFEALHPKRWYVSYPEFLDLEFHSLREVMGKKIDAYLPKGPDEDRFRSIFNEVQMVLFQHPVNMIREEKGKLPINSIWFWGGGRLPKLVAPDINRLWSNDWSSLSVAANSSIQIHTLSTRERFSIDEKKSFQDKSTRMVILNDLESWACYGDVTAWRETLNEVNEHWLRPMLNELKKGNINKITLIGFGENEMVEAELSRSSLWKLWKTPRTLKGILTHNA